MVLVLLAITTMLAFLLSGMSPILGGKTITLSPTPPVTVPISTGVGRYGGQCLAKEALDQITAQPVAFTCNGVDYVLAAENVVVDHIYIHPEKKLIERQECGGIKYYSWYCHPPDFGSLWQNTLWKAVPDAGKPPADGDKFNLYIKKNPDENAAFICKSGAGVGTAEAGEVLLKIAADENEVKTIRVGGLEAIFNLSNTAITIDIEQVPTRRKIDTITLQTPIGAVEYDVWVNLLKAFSPDEDKAIYLVEKGLLPETNSIPAGVPYKRYSIAKIFDGDVTQNSLQLKTFRIVPTPAVPWWNIYLPESKPVVYLYPEGKSEITVKVKPVKGAITISDPYYPEDGWKVIADRNSVISYENTIYPYLYYETEVAGYEIPKDGFVFEKENIDTDLRNLVERLGLVGRETDEFVKYWVDRFKKDIRTKYIFVGVISQDEMDRVVPLEITPRPATNIRVRLYFKGVAGGYTPQAPMLSEIKTRKGFTMVEWGGILE